MMCPPLAKRKYFGEEVERGTVEGPGDVCTTEVKLPRVSLVDEETP